MILEPAHLGLDPVCIETTGKVLTDCNGNKMGPTVILKADFGLQCQSQERGSYPNN